MSYKVCVCKKEIVLTSAWFFALTMVATVAPLIGHNQAVTGPIVNATLFIATALLGPQNAILVGLIPSVVALSTGLLPAVLAPIIPFIMISNTILILTFAYLRRKNFWLGVTAASVLKFVFLFSMSAMVMDSKMASMMSWPQLLTALAGGVIAYLALKSFKKR